MVDDVAPKTVQSQLEERRHRIKFIYRRSRLWGRSPHQRCGAGNVVRHFVPGAVLAAIV
jgi:hypothetical protein